MNKEEIAKSIDEGLKILKQEPSFVFNMEEIKAIEKAKLFEYKYTLTNNDDKVIETLINLISKLQKELDKKVNVINLMAQDRAEIGEPKVSEEAIINYYFKMVEEKNAKN